MKTINLFGLKLSLDIKRNKEDDEKRYSKSSTLREKIIYIIICTLAIVLSSKIALIYNNNNYKVGDVVREKIIAPKTIIFKDDFAKEKIIDNMIKEAGKEYVYSADAENVFLGYFNEFFDEIRSVKTKEINNIDKRSFERNLGKKIPDDIIENILSLSSITLGNLRNSSEKFLKKVYNSGIYQDKTEITIQKEFREELDKMPKLQKSIIETFLVPNYIYDEEKTKKSVFDKVSQVEDQYVEIKAGDTIADTGEILSERKIKIMESYNIYSIKKGIFYFITNVIYLLLISSIFYTMFFLMFKSEILDRYKYRSIFLILIAFFGIYRLFGNNYLYLLPADTALFLILLIVKGSYSVVIFPAMLAFALPMIDYNLVYFFLYMISFPIGMVMIRKVSTRSAIIAAGIKTAMLRLILFFLLTVFLNREISTLFKNMGFIMISGIISGTLTVALLPYFERTFNILTTFKLLELGNLSSPLLKKLSVEAPGTFNHSSNVATLAENAAIAIGADPTFSRVASYYHDIGKIKRPEFFTENQEPGKNPQDGVSPFMSKMIIFSHTKDGVELGRENGIPVEIRDIMEEHHGTSFLAYFYNLAKSENPDVNVEEFRYPGPKPKSKESAIIMLADSSEAAVRSLTEKTPQTIETIIRNIINSKTADHQLDDAALTFGELEKIITSFVKSLGGIYHARVKYPGQKI